MSTSKYNMFKLYNDKKNREARRIYNLKNECVYMSHDRQNDSVGVTYHDGSNTSYRTKIPFNKIPNWENICDLTILTKSEVIFEEYPPRLEYLAVFRSTTTTFKNEFPHTLKELNIMNTEEVILPYIPTTLKELVVMKTPTDNLPEIPAGVKLRT